MNLKIKKLIAREGLVILTISLLVLVTFILPDSYVTLDNKKPIDVLTEKRLEITDSINGTIYTVIINSSDIADKVEGFSFSKSKLIEELGRRGKLESIKGLNIVKKQISLVIFKENFFLFLLLCYPIYLVFRFVLWARNTLKEDGT